jgi:hypothetical protein
MRNIAMALWHQKTWQLLRNAGVTRRPLASSSPQCQQSLLPTSMWHSSAFGKHVNPSLLLLTPSLPTSKPLCMTPQLCQRQPCQNPQPCCHPPPPLHHHIWVQSSIPLGGGHASLAPPLPTALAPPSPTIVEGQPLRVRQHAQPRCCTGRRNRPRAPSPPNEVPPSHPYSLQGGASNTNYNHVGTSKLTLLLGGVVIYALLDNTAYSLCWAEQESEEGPADGH